MGSPSGSVLPGDHRGQRGAGQRHAEFSINRQDFGISYPGMRDDLIRDLVVLKLSLKLPRAS